MRIEAHELIAENVPAFVGNIEGRAILDGKVDVIVTDGFTGNVALKLLEGSSRVLLGQVRDAMTSSAWRKLLAAGLKPSLGRLRDRLDPDQYGGAPLLGCQRRVHHRPRLFECAGRRECAAGSAAQRPEAI